MNKPILFMMSGLPGSGKSHQAEIQRNYYDAVIYSSDKMREELTGDVNCQDKNDEIFKELHRRVKLDLSSGKNVIYDATNINYKKRKSFLEELKDIECTKICIFMVTPYRDCINQNNIRERKVPEDILSKMYKSIYIPQYYEGWDNITIVYNYNKDDYSIENLFKGEDGLNYIGQDNPHHTLTIGEHCIDCALKLRKMNEECSLELYEAALLHDIGKRYTKQFADYNGNPTTIAHYYQHNLVSAYDSLFYGHCKDKLLRANYIQWHMQPFFIENEKQANKYKQLWGNDFYNDITMLHEADKSAR
jgi:predicted kinase